jgi:hypothetical protein
VAEGGQLQVRLGGRLEHRHAHHVASTSRSGCHWTRNTSVASDLPRRYMGPMLRSLTRCSGAERVAHAVRGEDLVGAGQVGQAGGAVDGVAVAVALDLDHLAGFDAHLHLHRFAVPPGRPACPSGA